MIKVTIETIEHSQQRYPTVGDWWFDSDGLHIKVSGLSDWRYEALVAVHELIEAILCKHHLVSQEAIDAFDKQYELDRAAGKHSPSDEPGDDLDAPYRQEHCFATGIERMLAVELDVCWDLYSKMVESLPGYALESSRQ